MKTVAIVPAGGSGKRMQGGLSKQYLVVNGAPVLVHTLRVLQQSPMVHTVLLVVPSDDIGFVTKEIVEQYDLLKVGRILSGGKQRQDSVKAALDTLEEGCDIVLIHDGVRPCVSPEIIHSAILAAFNEAAVTVGVPVKDTLKKVDRNGWVMGTIDRNDSWLTQTPQAFKREVIKEAYRLAYHDGYYGTDDAVLVERMGVRVKMVPGSYENIKITTKDDLSLVERILKKRMDECISPSSGKERSEDT